MNLGVFLGGVSVGDVTVTATGEVNGVVYSDSAVLEVTNATVQSLLVTPKINQTPVGLEVQYVAEALFSDGRSIDVTKNDAVTWSSSQPNIAEVSNQLDSKGKAVGVSVGDVTVTATGEVNGVVYSDSAALEVTNAVPVTLSVFPDGKIAIGATWQLSAVVSMSDKNDIDVTNNPNLSWHSDSMLLVDVKKGLATGISEGIAKITAYYTEESAAFSDFATVEVDNSDFTLEAEDANFFGESSGIQYPHLPDELAFPDKNNPQGVKIDSFNQYFGYSNLSSAFASLNAGDEIKVIAYIDTINSSNERSNVLNVNIVNGISGSTIVIPMQCDLYSCEGSYVWSALDSNENYSRLIFKAGQGVLNTNIVYDKVSVTVK